MSNIDQLYCFGSVTMNHADFRFSIRDHSGDHRENAGWMALDAQTLDWIKMVAAA